MQKRWNQKRINRIRNNLLRVSVWLVLLIFAGCEDFFTSEATNVDIPGSEPQLVVYSFLSPGEKLTRVHVYRSIPYTMSMDDVEPVNDKASVYLAPTGEAFYQLEYNDLHNCFVAESDEFEVQYGQSYSLKVESYQGESVTANSLVPHTREMEVETEPLTLQLVEDDIWDEGHSVKHIQVDWKITLPANTGDGFMRTGAYMKRYIFHEGDSVAADVQVSQFGLERGQPYFAATENRTYAFRANKWRESYGFSGEHQGYDPPQEEGEVVDSVFVYVFQTDEHYYRFHKSLDEYFYYDDDFPFTEAVFIYSNIKGGLGVFAGYNRKEFYIPYPDIENQQ